MKILLIEPGEAPVLFSQDEELTLEFLQSQVHGPIEGITGDGWVGYVNEEGKLDGMPVNVTATELAGRTGWPGAGCDVLCGPVLFLGPEDPDTEEHTDVPQTVIETLRGMGDII